MESALQTCGCQAESEAQQDVQRIVQQYDLDTCKYLYLSSSPGETAGDTEERMAECKLCAGALAGAPRSRPPGGKVAWGGVHGRFSVAPEGVASWAMDVREQRWTSVAGRGLEVRSGRRL